ncbi:MAG: arginine deiminase family protein, partial [Streptococcus orisratti]|nr:arginine deiminase family protein [Streptococcus orisratti]
MTVIDGTSRLRKVLLCKPEFLVSAAPINVISEHYTKPLNRDKMMQEFESVVKAYEENEVEVIQVTSSENMPNAVFTRDFGGNVKEGYILGRFKKEIRFEERNHYEMIMSELGISKIAEVDDGYFEGGDFAFIDEKTLAIGVIDRTNLTGVDEIRKQLEPYGYKVYAVKANPDYLHLDMCFNLVSPNLAIAYEAGLPDDFLD